MEHADPLTKLFCDLVTIPSPSGQEAAVAAYIQAQLQAAGVAHEFDTAANDSNTGNLIARLPGDPSLPTLLFVAHMDTVETGEKSITPVLTNSVIGSDGSTILGADDKAAVACLLHMLPEIIAEQRRPSIVIVFTTREEQGRMGSSLLNLPDNIDMAFNIDGPNKLGDFAYQMLGEVPFTITIHGRAAHAAVEPEKGANALIAAGQVLTGLPIGKSAQDIVVNIGTVHGGTANNVVPDRAVLRGQVRAYTPAELDAALQQVEKVAAEAAHAHGCTYDFQTEPEAGAPPAALPTDHPMVAVAERAAKQAGLPFGLIKLSGTSDANYLAAKYPTLTICRGSTDPHAFTETISVATLHGLQELLVAIVRQVAKA